MLENKGAKIKSILKKVIPLISVFMFVIALWVMHHQLEHYRYRDIMAAMAGIPLHCIYLSLLCSAGSYLCLTCYDLLAVRYLKKTISYRKIAPVAYIGFALGHNVGNAFFAGGSIRYRIYSGMGMSSIEIIKITFFCTLTFWVGYMSLAGMSFMVDPPSFIQAVQGKMLTARWMGLLFLFLIVSYFIVSCFRKTPLRIKDVDITLPSPKIILGQVAAGCLDLACAAGTLYVLLPPQETVSFHSFLGIYLLSMIIGLSSQVPGGLGVFETTFLLLLGDSQNSSQMIGSLLLYRAAYYFLPLAVAMVLLVIIEIRHKRDDWIKLADTFAYWTPVIIPSVLSLSALVGGTILLLSGATPILQNRLAALITFLPLPVMELSHFLGSVVGMGLLLLARGILRKIDAAYFITVILLGFGVALSLLKGFDYEEAFLLGVMLLCFIPCRRHFIRKASLFHEPLSPGWIVTLMILVISSIWLGIFSYKHLEYSSQLWWQFSAEGDAPRFLRATAGVMITAMFYAIARFMSPALPKTHEVMPEEIERALPLIHRCPKGYSQLAFTGDKRFLFSETGKSFIMYSIEGSSWIALGDPVGDKDEWQELIWEFRDVINENQGQPVFYQIDSDNLPLYLDLGLTVLKIGEEARIPLKKFSLEGNHRKNFRHIINKLDREGCTFEIIPEERVPAFLPQFRQISENWLQEKNTKEKGFSLGFYTDEYVKRFPCAVVRCQGEIVAFANVLLGFEKFELTVDLMRYSPKASTSVMEYLFLHLFLWGQKEGFHWFNMGMAPLSGLVERPLAPFWNKVGGWIFHHGEHFYNFAGIREYKEKFDPVWVPKYLASPGGLHLARTLLDITTLISGGVKGIISK